MKTQNEAPGTIMVHMQLFQLEDIYLKQRISLQKYFGIEFAVVYWIFAIKENLSP